MEPPGLHACGNPGQHDEIVISALTCRLSFFTTLKSGWMKRAVLIAMTVLAVSCGHEMHSFGPLPPVAPTQNASELEARTFENAGLRQFVEAALHRTVSWPAKELDFKLLTLAAFYFNPDLAVARTQVAFAEAGIQTARMRPNPVLDFSPGVPSPYLVGLGLAIPVITSGKRRYAIEAAKNMHADAQLQLAELAWTVRGRVRATLLNVLAAERGAALAQEAQRLQESKLERTGDMLQAGEIGRTEWETARTSLLAAAMATRTAESQVSPARASLAAVIGLPVEALAGKQLVWPDFDKLPSVNKATDAQIRRDAIVNRLDVRRSLSQYEAAERKLQLEIARRHPNFNLGPGYQLEEGHSYFAPTLSVALPIFNRNEGPIAEAEAKRKTAAANLMSVQANVLAQSEQALSRYESEYKLSAAARAVRDNWTQKQAPLVRRRVSAGEIDWFAMNSVEIQRSTAETAWIDSVFQTQRALGQLEDAVQKPLEAGDDVPMILPK